MTRRLCFTVSSARFISLRRIQFIRGLKPRRSIVSRGHRHGRALAALTSPVCLRQLALSGWIVQVSVILEKRGVKHVREELSKV